MNDPDSISVSLNWDGQFCFTARNTKGSDLMVDGNGEAGLSPLEGLLASLSSCISIDVVDMLSKMRLRPNTFTVRAFGKRNSYSPRCLTMIQLRFIVSQDVPSTQVERAIQLSFDKYSSVFHSIRSDIQVLYSLEVVNE